MSTDEAVLQETPDADADWGAALAEQSAAVATTSNVASAPMFEQLSPTSRRPPTTSIWCWTFRYR